MNRLAVPVLLLALVACADAGTTDPDVASDAEDACGSYADRPESVRVRPVSDQHDDLHSAWAQWRPSPNHVWYDCEPDEDGWFVCGVRLPGAHELRLSASGHQTRFAAVDVPSDGCWGPVTREVELALESADCPEDVPAVHVLAYNGCVGSMPRVDAYWRLVGSDEPFRPCDRMADGPADQAFTCAMNRWGTFEISDNPSGSYAERVDVPTDTDGCPLTQELEWYYGP